MEYSIKLFLIVCPLVFFAGFVDAIAGGGGMISLPAYMFAGLPMHMAIGTNKLSSGMGTALATGRLAKSGQIPWKQGAMCVCAALIGSSFGAKLALTIDAMILKRLMLVVLPVTAYYVFRSNPATEQTSSLPPLRENIRIVLIALVIGVYDGFYGPGTGTFLILLFTSVAKISLGRANGLAKASNLATNVAALTVYLLSGKVLFLLGITAGICSITGNYLGISYFKKKGSKAVKPVMLFVIFLFFVRILTEIF